MDLLQPISPSGSLQIPSTPDSTVLINQILALRTKIASSASVQLIVLLEQYSQTIASLVRVLHPLASNSTLFQKAFAVECGSSPLWRLPFSQLGLRCKWTLFHELSIVYTNLCVLYINVASSKVLKECYEIDMASLSPEIREQKWARWTAIGENYLKKAASLARFNSQSTSAVLQKDNVLETSQKFVDFIQSYCDVNLQYSLVLLRSSWAQRYGKFSRADARGDAMLIHFEPEQFNDDFYEKNYCRLLTRVATFINSELNSILGFVADFRAQLSGSVSGQLKNALTKLKDEIEMNSDDEDEENDEKASVNSPNPFRKSLLSLSALEKRLEAFRLYIKLYLVEFLSIESYVKNSDVGTSIGLIDYGFHMVNREKATKMSKFKAKFGKKAAVFVPTGQKSDFEKIIVNLGLYKKRLGVLALADFNTLVINLSTMKHKFTVENDNLSFHKVPQLTDDDFNDKLGLGLGSKVTLKEFTPFP